VSKTVIGVFKSKDQAEKAVNELKEIGIGHQEISIVTKDESREHGRAAGRGGLQSRAGEGDVGDVADIELAGQDVGSGVTWGGGLGGLAGILAGAGALAVPGIGPVLAAGPLAAALSGAVTGGLAGGLIDYGIPEERGRDYERRVKEGGVLTVVRTSDEKADRAAEVLRTNGADNVEIHRAD